MALYSTVVIDGDMEISSSLHHKIPSVTVASRVSNLNHLTIQGGLDDLEFFDRLAEQAAHVASLIRIANAAESKVGAPL